METVNFQCGHCGQVLAVSMEHVGQQVRCPHCQQVVVAPLPSSPGPAQQFPDTLEVPYRPPAEEYESIFSAPTESEDLFGGHPSGRVEMPPDVAPPPPPPSPTAALPLMPEVELHPVSPTVPFPPPAPEGTLSDMPDGAPGYPRERVAPAPPESSATPETDAPPTPTEPPAPVFDEQPGEGGEDLASVFRGGPVRTSKGGGWYIALFIMPLISYSVLATLVAGIYMWRYYTFVRDVDEGIKQQPHPLEFLPDLEGDNPAGKRPKSTLLHVPRPGPNEDLPPQLRATLGQTLQVGDLEVEPLRVERGRLEISSTPMGKTQETEHEALKLWLRLKNVSRDLTFCPLDRYFTRKYDPSRDRPPYTQLIVGGRHFYGGPGDWADSRQANTTGNNEFVKGQEAYERPLKPGQEVKTFVCTDPENKELAQTLAAQPGGKREWRVQLRRGVVEVKGRRIPASCVIGVEFFDK
ncbi:MAG: hypothetical protein HYS12_02410 [Planctomycetes bacterium]|nr:hypothetical protein [Planctomycetota bacterium]